MIATRELIRERARDLLECARIVPPKRVHTNRFRPVRDADLPAIAIYTKLETGLEQEGSAPMEYRREAEIVFDILLKRYETRDNDVDVRLDRMAHTVERLIFGNPTLQLDETMLYYRRTEIETIDEGELAFGVLHLVFEARYYRVEAEGCSSSLPGLRTVVNGWDLGPVPDGNLEAVDELQLSGASQ